MVSDKEVFQLTNFPVFIWNNGVYCRGIQVWKKKLSQYCYACKFYVILKAEWWWIFNSSLLLFLMTLVHFLLFSCLLSGTSLKYITLTSEIKVTRGRKVAIALNYWYSSYITGLLHHSKCVKYLQKGCIEA